VPKTLTTVVSYKKIFSLNDGTLTWFSSSSNQNHKAAPFSTNWDVTMVWFGEERKERWKKDLNAWVDYSQSRPLYKHPKI